MLSYGAQQAKLFLLNKAPVSLTFEQGYRPPNPYGLAASRVGHLRFTFQNSTAPYILVEATRPTTIGSPASPSSKIVFPWGTIFIDTEKREITGRNPERQDAIIGPISTPASGFNGYFCARFDTPFNSWGIAQNGTLHDGGMAGEGAALSAYVRFGEDVTTVDARIGVSFISIDQARRNLDKEIPDGTSLEETAKQTRAAWKDHLDRIQIDGATDDQKAIFYTAFYHTLQVSFKPNWFTARSDTGYFVAVPL